MSIAQEEHAPLTLSGKPQARASHVAAPAVDPALRTILDQPWSQKLDAGQDHDREVRMAAQESLNFIMSGNKAMRVGAEDVQKVVGEIGRHVEEFLHQRKSNPGLCVSHLKAKIGPSSPFADSHKKRLAAQPAEPPRASEPPAAREKNCPLHGVFCRDACHDGKVAYNHHAYGQPPV